MAKKETKATAKAVTKPVTTFKEVDGDVLDLFFKSKTDAAFLHGANCQKIMGAGIAEQVRMQIAPLFYIDQYDQRSNFQRFGSYSAVVIGKVEDKIKIGVNLYTQFLPGPSFDMNAFINSLRAFKLSIPPEKRGDLTLYVPKIGCGIGGADWKDVEPTIKRELAEFNIVAVNYVPAKEEEIPVEIAKPKKAKKK